VLATDLSEAALAEAEAGRYPVARVADVPEALRMRYFALDQPGGEAVVQPPLRAGVRFLRQNLLEVRYPRGFDVILCRNVLIYFDAQARGAVIARLAGALRPGGYLFLGYAETLRDHGELFESVRDEDGVIYRRRGGDEGRGDDDEAGAISNGNGSAVAGTSAAASTSTSTSTSVGATANGSERGGVSVRPKHGTSLDDQTTPILHLHGDYHDPERLARELKPLIAAARAILELDGAAYLGNEAARVLLRAVEAAPGLELRARRPAVRRWLARHGLERGAK
jgi:SAM-dependent methyltransferase